MIPGARASLPGFPPSYNEADVSDKPGYVRELSGSPFSTGWPLTRTCESLLSVDEMLADVEQRMIAQGRTNVLYILTSDNGMGLGANRWVKKRAPYATKMPLYLHWLQGLGASRRRITTTVANVDLAPTLCELAGCTMGPFPNGRPVDGLSLVPLLDRSTRTLPRTFLIEEHHTRRTNPRWLGIRTTAQWRLGRWRYTRYETGEEELYDLTADPWMLINRALDPEYASVRRSLERRLDRATVDDRAPARRRSATSGGRTFLVSEPRWAS